MSGVYSNVASWKALKIGILAAEMGDFS